jgi:hypothetical protein
MKFLNLRKNFNKIFFILAVFSFIGFASASIPQLIAFQGKLTDKNGALINGNTLITFNIYTTQTGGSSIYTESDNINVSNGLVSWLIGSNTPLTLPFNQQYYLGVTVDGDDSEMTPRLALSAAPYAFNSINANNSAFLNGIPGGIGGSYALVNGNYPSMTVGNATNANNSNNSAFLNSVPASSYYVNNTNIFAQNATVSSRLYVGPSGVAFPAGFVAVFNGSIFTPYLNAWTAGINGGLTAESLTASTLNVTFNASIEGHTPWTNGVCTFGSGTLVSVPSNYCAIAIGSCPSGDVALAAGFTTNANWPNYVTEYWSANCAGNPYCGSNENSGSWIVGFCNPTSTAINAGVNDILCCPG